jgi:hypothetical protein
MKSLVLPPCSMAGCEREAGAIINSDLLCGEHAALVLAKIVAERRHSTSAHGGSGPTTRLS